MRTPLATLYCLLLILICPQAQAQGDAQAQRDLVDA